MYIHQMCHFDAGWPTFREERRANCFIVVPCRSDRGERSVKYLNSAVEAESEIDLFLFFFSNQMILYILSFSIKKKKKKGSACL